jgi:hypothetical protein
MQLPRPRKHSFHWRRFFTRFGLWVTALLSACWIMPSPYIYRILPANPAFGLAEAYQHPQLAQLSSASWQRIRLHWGWIQPNNANEWVEFEIRDAEIDHEVAAQREMVALLQGIPAWGRGADGLPLGLWLPEADPQNLWAQWVRTAATRYQGKIRHWIVWNEPEIWQTNHPAYSWHGTVADFAQLQKVSYRVLKQVDANNQVFLPGYSHHWDAEYGRQAYLRLLLAELAKDPQAGMYNQYFDHFTFNLYFNPEGNYQILKDWRDWLTAQGYTQSHWLMETNAPPSDDPLYPVPNAQFKVSLQEQAAYIPQMLALSLVLGLERSEVYVLLDPAFGADPEPFGLARRDGTTRPAFRSFQTATHLLSEVQSATLQKSWPYWWVTLDQPDRITHVLWTRTTEPLEVELPATKKLGMQTDVWGHSEWIWTDGHLRLVTLPPAECSNDPCFIGGMPVYIVEWK